jgi:hypothetical protein
MDNGEFSTGVGIPTRSPSRVATRESDLVVAELGGASARRMATVLCPTGAYASHRGHYAWEFHRELRFSLNRAAGATFSHLQGSHSGREIRLLPPR